MKIGDELKLTKGPFGTTDMIAFYVGADPVGIKAFLSALKVYRRHPAWCIRDPNTYALEPIYAVHYNKYVANAAGLPYPFDVGVQRQCFLIQMLTNWWEMMDGLKRIMLNIEDSFSTQMYRGLKGKLSKSILIVMGNHV